MAFPNFYGKKGENASNFLDDLEMAFLVSGRDSAKIKLRAFPLVLREEAKVWFQGLEEGRQGETAPNFLQKERFLAGLAPVLREKVTCKFPDSFEDALTWARLKDRKLQFQRSMLDQSQAAAAGTTSQEQAPPPPPNESGDPHLDLLQRVTNQLDNLSINLIHGLQPQQPAQPQAQRQGPNGQAQRRPPKRDIHCYNCNEDGHALTNQALTPMPMPIPVQQQQQPPPPVQILRQQPAPQPIAEVPPLPEAKVERAVNVIRWEDKGKEKEREAEVMPVKKSLPMRRPLAAAVWILRGLPSELREKVVLEKLSRTGFAWKSGNTLHIQGWLLLQQGTDNDLIACYLAMRLGLVQVVKLTTYIIQPVYSEGTVVGRTVNLITEDQFKLFQEIARGAVLELEASDEAFLWSYKFKDF
ncbi:hypothetical protein L7F22_035356 [Adiantum nelumboides]|nr:hypothetical protein [Adiantum nelumboides]